MDALLRVGIEYNPIVAGDYIIDTLLSLVPGDERDEVARPKFR